jgi:hypothetical protein
MECSSLRAEVEHATRKTKTDVRKGNPGVLIREYKWNKTVSAATREARQKSWAWKHKVGRRQ